MRTRDEYRIVGILGGFAVMRLLVLCALVLGFGSLVLIGLLALVRDCFSDSIFGVPSVSEAPARQGHTDAARSWRGRTTLQP